jgi:DNA-binding response OmpR family regulator
MVVDDDKEMLKLLNHVLVREGFDTVVIADGNSALTLLGQTNPDLVVLDIMMPGLDGFQMLDLIREQSDVPIIILSAKQEAESLRKALLLGADDYVRKPFSTRSFVARIRAKLRRPRWEERPPMKKEAGVLQ